MKKQLFEVLTLCSVLSVAYFMVILFYKKRSHFSQLYPSVNVNDSFFWRAQRVSVQQQVWTMTTEARGANQTANQTASQTQTTGQTTLGPCPDTPPRLVGALRVDFDRELTLDQARQDIGPPLREGGRHKPPDCIARQKVAIILPFRNRDEHLKHWLYYLHPILIRQQLDYGVYVINQDGEGVFNRAKLMNVGYVESLKQYDYDCFVFSDIDLIPMDDRNLYRCFDKPRHLAVAMDKFNFDLPYKNFFGGVSSLSKSQFQKINGFPNTYWGWGGEDDDIIGRIVFHGMGVSRPDLKIGRYKMIKHQRDLHNEVNPKNPDKLRHTKWTMKTDGINSLSYSVKDIVKDVLYTNITVDIEAPPT